MIWMMTLILVCSNGFVFGASSQPIVGTINSDETQVVETGGPVSYVLKIYNSGTSYARNVAVTLTGDHPFKSDISNLTQTVGYLNPRETKELTFNLNVSPLAEQKLYEFTVQFDYIDAYDTPYTVTSKAYVEVENNNIEPIVGITSYRSGYSSVKPGVDDGILIYLKNDGTIAAKDIRITLTGFSNTGIVLENDFDTKYLQTLESKETVFTSYRIKAGPNATSGAKTLTANISYIDAYGHNYTKEYPLYFQVEGADSASADVVIGDVVYPTTLKANQDFDVTYTVTNNSGVDLAYVEAQIQYPSDFVAKTPSKKVIRDLKAGASETITTTIMTKSTLSEQNYDGWINVKYYVKGDTADNMQEINSYLGFFVEAVTGSSKPKLIIDHYEYGGENVLAGENYTLSLYIKNTSNSEATQNIKVTLSGEDNVFTPVDSSSSFFINRIGPGEVYKHEITLKTKIDAGVKIYTMTVEMAYEDGSGNAYDPTDTPYSEKEDLSIAVAQPVRLETADLIVPWEIYAGQPFYIEQEFYNMGKSTMYNMMVKLEGVESSEASYFVGNFETGTSDYFSAQAYAYEEGTFDGKLIYTFEDALGNQSTQEVPFTFNVMPSMPIDNGGEFPTDGGMYPEEPVQDNGAVKLLVGGVLAIVVITGVLILRKKRKAKRLAALEDLDE